MTFSVLGVLFSGLFIFGGLASFGYSASVSDDATGSLALRLVIFLSVGTNKQIDVAVRLNIIYN